jgi:predicted dinucleotide-binding enzyme
MNIGILGAGNVGGTLGTRWAQGGHHVTFGVRNPAAPEMTALLAKAGKTARAAALNDAVAASDVILLATPWAPTQGILAGLPGLAGKILIDATNPLLPDLSLAVGINSSGGELVAQWAPGARVVKAFNTVGSGIMENPAFGADRAVLLYCGDDAEAKKAVRPLIDELGLDSEDAGPLRQARLLEPCALLWITMALVQGYGVNIAFKLLRR